VRDNFQMSMADNGWAAIMTRWDRDTVRTEVLPPLSRLADAIRNEDEYE
jgi:hypothetical protein